MPRTATKPSPMQSPDALRAGVRIGELQIERTLLTGGFSVIYLASDRARGLRVAVEEYMPTLLATRGPGGAEIALRQPVHAEAFERGLLAFLAEADLLTRCVHPSLPRVQRRWRANGTAYREMPYEPATRLRRLRQGMNEPPDEDVLRLLLDGVLGALDVLHAAGQVHGAISADNILLRDADDSPLLLGFDSAQRAIVGGQAQALMRAIGAGYAPLDRSDSGEPGPWADIYALASVIRFCIDGDGGSTPMAIAARRADPRPQIVYSAQLLAAIDWAMAAQPQDRPLSVAQFRAALIGRGRSGTVASWPAGEAPLGAAPAPQPAPPPMSPMPPPAVRHPTASPSQHQQPSVAAAAETLRIDPPPVIDFPPGLADDFRAEHWATESEAGEPLAGDAPVPMSNWQRLGVWAGSIALAAALVFAGWQIQQQWRNNAAERGLARVTEGRLPMTVTVPESARRPPSVVPQADPALAIEAQPPSAGPVGAAPVEAARPPVADMPASTSIPVPIEPAAPAAMPIAAPKDVPPVHARPTPATPLQRSTPEPLRAPETPLAACSPRTQFALYRCMQTQCARRPWRDHPQCVRLRENDLVG